MNPTGEQTSVREVMLNAHRLGLAIPAFNIPYLPMLEPVVQALVDKDTFGLIATARLEWIKFEAGGLAQVRDELIRWNKPEYVRLHLDHVPVIDEDNLTVETMPIFQEAIPLGYESLMVDGSRLTLEENISAVKPVVSLAHAKDLPVEAELGAVLGHENGPMPSYEELFTSGKGFTDPQEARQFVTQTSCDWLSVAIGNIHGAIAAGRKDLKKIEARLNLERLDQIHQATGIPLVLHGGSGIRAEDMRGAMKLGISKINVATEIRQAYEVTLKQTNNVFNAQRAVYERTGWVIDDFLGLAGTRRKLTG
jgi:fructose-bisphosphate aldolase class II